MAEGVAVGALHMVDQGTCWLGRAVLADERRCAAERVAASKPNLGRRSRARGGRGEEVASLGDGLGSSGVVGEGGQSRDDEGRELHDKDQDV